VCCCWLLKGVSHQQHPLLLAVVVPVPQVFGVSLWWYPIVYSIVTIVLGFVGTTRGVDEAVIAADGWHRFFEWCGTTTRLVAFVRHTAIAVADYDVCWSMFICGLVGEPCVFVVFSSLASPQVETGGLRVVGSQCHRNCCAHGVSQAGVLDHGSRRREQVAASAQHRWVCCHRVRRRVQRRCRPGRLLFHPRLSPHADYFDVRGWWWWVFCIVVACCALCAVCGAWCESVVTRRSLCPSFGFSYVPGLSSIVNAFRRIWQRLVLAFVPLFGLMYWFGTMGFLIFGKSCLDSAGDLDPLACNGHNYFGTLADSMWSLLQIATMDSWSSNIARTLYVLAVLFGSGLFVTRRLGGGMGLAMAAPSQNGSPWRVDVHLLPGLHSAIRLVRYDMPCCWLVAVFPRTCGGVRWRFVACLDMRATKCCAHRHVRTTCATWQCALQHLYWHQYVILVSCKLTAHVAWLWTRVVFDAP